MKILLTPNEEYVLKLAVERSRDPIDVRGLGRGDCINELWDVATCHIHHETLTNLVFMNFLTITWIKDGNGNLRNYRINNAGRHALWLHEREKEKEANTV